MDGSYINGILMDIFVEHHEEWNEEYFDKLIPKSKEAIFVIKSKESDPLSYKHLDKLWAMCKAKTEKLSFNVESYGNHLDSKSLQYFDGGVFVVPSLKLDIYKAITNRECFIIPEKMYTLTKNKPWRINIPVRPENMNEDQDILHTFRVLLTTGFKQFIFSDPLGLGSPLEKHNWKPTKKLKNGTYTKLLGAEIIYQEE